MNKNIKECCEKCVVKLQYSDWGCSNQICPCHTPAPQEKEVVKHFKGNDYCKHGNKVDFDCGGCKLDTPKEKECCDNCRSLTIPYKCYRYGCECHTQAPQEKQTPSSTSIPTAWEAPQEEKEPFCKNTGNDWRCEHCLVDAPTPDTPSEWEKKLAPKTQLINWENEETRQMVQDLLDFYWEKIKPEISNLLQKAREEGRQEILKEIEGEVVWSDLDISKGSPIEHCEHCEHCEKARELKVSEVYAFEAGRKDTLASLREKILKQPGILISAVKEGETYLSLTDILKLIDNKE